MKHVLSIVGIFLVVGIVSVSLFAYDTAWGRGRGGEGFWGGAGSCRGSGVGPAQSRLTEEQEVRLDALYQSHYDETAPIKNDLWAKRAQMRTLLGASEVDENKILSLQKEINALQSTLAEKRVEYRLRVREVAPDHRFAGRYGKGYGSHMRGGYGPGMQGGGKGYGPGACWQ